MVEVFLPARAGDGPLCAPNLDSAIEDFRMMRRADRFECSARFVDLISAGVQEVLGKPAVQDLHVHVLGVVEGQLFGSHLVLGQSGHVRPKQFIECIVRGPVLVVRQSLNDESMWTLCHHALKLTVLIRDHLIELVGAHPEVLACGFFTLL
ncbi:MAG TPA: hypothetical protein VGP92_19750, partial [Acidimicrobiia bacterium]|nr:hypothetical protein [Acidimicrobiia bacterium]